MNLPLVTVVMPVYNASKYLQQAIDSILQQTYSDFVLMIINDGSIDDSEKIILSNNDERIKYISNETNIGLSNTLNRAIDIVETKYFARIDADDIAVPERLQWQIEFMENYHDIGVCGGYYERFGNASGIVQMPLKDEEIKSDLLIACRIPHPTVIIRTQVLKENGIYYGVPFTFDDEFGHRLLELEDFALWHKLKSKTNFANLNKVILKYRMEGQNLSTQREELILKRKLKFFSSILSELNLTASEQILLILISSSNFNAIRSKDLLILFQNFLNEIIEANRIRNIYPQKELLKTLQFKKDNLFAYLPESGFYYCIIFWRLNGKIQWSKFIYAIKYFIKFRNWK